MPGMKTFERSPVKLPSPEIKHYQRGWQEQLLVLQGSPPHILQGSTWAPPGLLPQGRRRGVPGVCLTRWCAVGRWGDSGGLRIRSVRVKRVFPQHARSVPRLSVVHLEPGVDAAPHPPHWRAGEDEIKSYA